MCVCSCASELYCLLQCGQTLGPERSALLGGDAEELGRTAVGGASLRRKLMDATDVRVDDPPVRAEEAEEDDAPAVLADDAEEGCGRSSTVFQKPRDEEACDARPLELLEEGGRPTSVIVLRSDALSLLGME
ncbi:hypothetical protein FGB62_109g01 [Gracilaria domingensis]|nr:hypothetical protein FGB62_109g01 [Gracilaria domingensis]